VLVDEYDKPILDNLTRPEIAREMRDGLRNLYSVIKGLDAHIRFAMLTGVSKFSKVSLFSGLNNLNDITIDPDYSAICGYTEADLEQVFAPELPGLDRDEIRSWYNGYNWTGEAVYNPFDLLLLFDKRSFHPWWFETGSPRFLIDLLIERETWLPALDRQIAPETLLSRFDIGDLPTEALLFQTGYLTIDRAERIGPRWLYHLRYPNLEVRIALNEQLLDTLTASRGLTDARLYRLAECLRANDFEGVRVIITALFDAIPREWHIKNPMARYEGYYASVLYTYLASLGLDLTPEDSSNAGRLDLAVRHAGQLYLFEFKVVELAPDGSALADQGPRLCRQVPCRRAADAPDRHRIQPRAAHRRRLRGRDRCAGGVESGPTRGRDPRGNFLFRCGLDHSELTRPARIANLTSPTKLSMPSLSIRRPRWVSTVLTLMPRSRAMSLVRCP
jgi:hypothetical protein